jgi:hypothetical protein
MIFGALDASYSLLIVLLEAATMSISLFEKLADGFFLKDGLKISNAFAAGQSPSE